MKPKKNGYALIVTCFLLPIVFLGLGLITFSLLKTRHLNKIKTSCRNEYYSYFSDVKSQIYLIENLGQIAITLYQTQMALLPFIWVPAVLKIYQKILKVRQYLDKTQRNFINALNVLNTLRSYSVISKIQRTLLQENNKMKGVLTYRSHTSFNVNSKLHIVKKMQILFPPFVRAPNIAKKQAFTINLYNKIKPQSWISFFHIGSLSENYSCSATLRSNTQNNLIIDYII